MNTAEILALVRAHGGRVRAVACLHVLRQRALGVDDLVFLREHVGHLEILDLLRWRSLCEAGHTGEVVREIARRAVLDPADFAHEVLSAPRLDFDADEWRDLEDALRGKVPEKVWARLLRRSREQAPREQSAPPVVALRTQTLALFDADELAETAPLLADPGGEPPGEQASLEELWAWLKAARRPEERLCLLERIEATGGDRKALLDAAVALLGAAETTDDVAGALARGLFPRQMGTRAAWERSGEAVVSALVTRRAWGEASELVAVVWAGNPAPAEAQRGFLAAIQWALGKVLVDEARAALARGDERVALGALSALLCLDPPSRLSRAVHALRHAAGASRDALELIGYNERMIKHGRGGDASLEDVIAAVHALADALG